MKSALYLSQIRLINVRCFEDITIQLGEFDSKVPWTLILGDNATGKTTLLRSIALGLCDESNAATLLKESDEGYIRRGENKAVISLILEDKDKPGKHFQIITRIKRVKERRVGSGRHPYEYELVRQVTTPKREDFPWKDIFVCGYGAGRGTSGTGDVSGYSPVNTLYNMFNYTEGLQNPELVIRRHFTDSASSTVLSPLQEATKTKRIRLGIFEKNKGLLIDGPWGDDMPFRDLPDGYKSNLLWLADFLGWVIDYHEALVPASEIDGIVLIDEIEQHLHPLWQREIIGDLYRIFPKVQFIATTHSPICAGGLSDIDPEYETTNLIRLIAEDKHIKFEKLHSLAGLRYDQILTGVAFRTPSRGQHTKELLEEIRSEYERLGTKARESEKFTEALRKLQSISVDAAEDEMQRQTQVELTKKINELIKLDQKEKKNNEKI